MLINLKYYDVTVINKKDKHYHTYVYAKAVKYNKRHNSIEIVLASGDTVTYSLNLWWVFSEPIYAYFETED